MRKRLASLCLASLCLAFLGQTACAPDEPVSLPPTTMPSHGADGRSWTVLVYMVADNYLEQAALDDLSEMMHVGSTADLHVVVLCDRRPGGTEKGLGGLPNWTTAQRLWVGQDRLESRGDLGELDLGDPQVLTDFLAWGMRAYPADRYALVFWDHGAGARGFGLDETNGGNSLTLPELDLGIRKGLKAAGVTQLALVGFDACLMATYEVAAVLQPYAEYLLASQETEPTSGWDWTSLQRLRDEPTTPPQDLGARIVEDYGLAPHQQAGSLTLSLTDLVALDAVDAALQGLTAQLSKHLAGKPGQLGQAGQIGKHVTSTLKFGSTADPSHAFHAVDLGLLAHRLADLAPLGEDLNRALQHANVTRMAVGPASDATGLSIYFPLAKSDYRPGYDAIPRLQTWRSFLKAWYAAGDAAPKGPSFAVLRPKEGHAAAANWTAAGWQVSGALVAGAAGALLDAGARFGKWDAAMQNATLYVEQTADIALTTVNAHWNGQLPQLRQGEHTALAYVTRSVQPVGGHALTTWEVPLTYRQGATQHFIVLRQIATDDGVVTSTGYFETTSAGVAAIQPDPQGSLWPWVAILDENGSIRWHTSTQTAFTVQGLVLEWVAIAPGSQAFAQIRVEALGGQVDFVQAVGVVP